MNGQPSSPGMCRNALGFGGVVTAGETTLCIDMANTPLEHDPEKGGDWFSDHPQKQGRSYVRGK
jgi:hypothetical protein